MARNYPRISMVVEKDMLGFNALASGALQSRAALLPRPVLLQEAHPTGQRLP
jgi:hypothetical protein